VYGSLVVVFTNPKLEILYKNLLVKELCCNFAVEIKNSMQTMEQEPRYPVGYKTLKRYANWAQYM
jgi:hypothetical protein